MAETAILLMAYGTPNSIEEIEPYLIDIRRGRKPSPEAVEDLKRRYLKIGGGSPLLEITREQASALEKRLRSEGVTHQVYFGMKHWHPYIREVVPEILGDGYDRIVGLVLAPHYSMMSIEGYKSALQEAVSSNSTLSVDFVDSWYDNHLFHQAVHEKIRDALKQFAQPEKVHLLFTAHSLPERILASKDPYPTQLEYSCRSVANLLGRKEWSFAYQSAGQTDEKWLGPDILDYIQESQHRISDVLVVPIGFVADHLEILYDIDVEAQDLAQTLSVNLRRTESLNTSPTFISALTDIVQKRIDSAA